MLARFLGPSSDTHLSLGQTVCHVALVVEKLQPSHVGGVDYEPHSFAPLGIAHLEDRRTSLFSDEDPRHLPFALPIEAAAQRSQRRVAGGGRTFRRSTSSSVIRSCCPAR
jgi:hypothetical protein